MVPKIEKYHPQNCSKNICPEIGSMKSTSPIRVTEASLNFNLVHFQNQNAQLLNPVSVNYSHSQC